ncbi:MAG: hypothetical protein H3C30_06460 [Candidatus Hydrogenedentes bacterium]|nr:hypothetical protein [Candidatus Hydrogenedentota bacterium]
MPPIHPKRLTKRTPYMLFRHVKIIGIVFLAPIVFISCQRHFSEKCVEAHLAAIKAVGYPISLEELGNWKSLSPSTMHMVNTIQSASFSDTPENVIKTISTARLNALENIFIQEGLSTNISDAWDSLNMTGVLDDSGITVLRKHLDSVSASLELLLGTSDIDIERFPLNYLQGYDLELPHLVKLRSASRLLRGAAYMAALDNNSERAYRCILAGLQIIRSLDLELVSVSQGVKIACNGIMFSGLQETLGVAEYSDAQLVRLHHAFLRGHDQFALRNILVSERVFGLSAYDHVSDFMEFEGIMGRSNLPKTMSVLVKMADIAGYYHGDREHFLDVMDKLIESATLPYGEFSSLIHRLSGQFDRSLFLPSISKEFLTFLSEFPAAVATNQARMYLASTACAIERYRLANGAPPDTLTALVPAYLPAPPMDPFDSQPMRYRREGTAYTLYSVNVDGVDGGGVAGENAREGDLVFTRRP